MSHAFSQVIAVLMRDPDFRNLKLADLEWLVLPPIMAGQFKLGRAQVPSPGSKSDAKDQQSGLTVPVAVAVWARVSPEIDAALSANLDKRVKLQANQWASGDRIWLMAAAGDPHLVPHFLKQLGETEFKGQVVKIRTRGPDGKVVIKTLSQYIEPARVGDVAT